MKQTRSMLLLWEAILAALCLLCAWGICPQPAVGDWRKAGADILDSLSPAVGRSEPSSGEIGAAFKEALKIGTEKVVERLGLPDGFNRDAAVHIPLPESLGRVKTLLEQAGAPGLLSDLELRLNRAAEAAAPRAKAVFLTAVSEMSFEDVRRIYNGPRDAATRYFQEKMTPALAAELRPIVEERLGAVGALQAYDKAMGSYKALPFVPDVKADLTAHVVARGMDGIFHYLAVEEAAIRNDPAQQTTALLQKVFGRSSPATNGDEAEK